MANTQKGWINKDIFQFLVPHLTMKIFLYLEIIKSIIPGVTRPLKCPVCIKPTNLTKWKKLLGEYNKAIATFEMKITQACHVTCPKCHEMHSTLPPLSMAKPHEIFKMNSQLCTLCCQYCRHRRSVNHITNMFLIHFLIRRVALYLRWRREDPFICTLCCGANFCFSCKTSGHHIGEPCQAFEELEDIAQCPNCKLHVVKGDGCDIIFCFCGRMGKRKIGIWF
ncbi:hypothetical protein THRCLA_09079 [Thraustotheca clavata]|uniref:RING-type domain-containing protein n=1 Tax=Thraustotheca clavata TaxID=74557 RepID=A0A1V9YZV7_9STRA|nr:hypothetical protein THRCLA_09079 [Thraustotheca clavata]